MRKVKARILQAEYDERVDNTASKRQNSERSSLFRFLWLGTFSDMRRFTFCIALAACFGCASIRSRSIRETGVPPTAVPNLFAPQGREGKVGADRTSSGALYAVREELNLIYGHAGGEDLQLDLFVPKDVPGPFPTVVILHGGGWAAGSHEGHRPLAGALAARGYAAASVGYRLVPRHRFPAQIQDAKCAVRWLRAHAERYQIDKEHIAALGFSAGAHLALLLGLTEPRDGFEGTGGHPEQSSCVQAVINISGPTDLTQPNWPQATQLVIADFLGTSREQNPGLYRAASPLFYVHRGAPPVLTIHGTADPVVPYEQAQLLHTALRKARVPSRLVPLHGKDHGENWSTKEQQRNTAAILAFLDAHLRQR